MGKMRLNGFERSGSALTTGRPVPLTARSQPARLAKAACALGLVLAASAQADLVVDRGLPDLNLNNDAGSDRSNVAWGFFAPYLSGDDFTLTSASNNFVIDRVRVWAVTGSASDDQFVLEDRFDRLSLFLGKEDDGEVDRVATTTLTGNTPGNSNVTVSNVTYATSGADYQGSGGGFLNIWQIDFENLGFYTGGQFLFSLGGVPVGEDDAVFSHASNAALSGTPQQGSDNQYRWFAGTADDTSITAGGFIDSQGNGWDKSSDINIQVFATDVPAPATLGLLAAGLLGFAGAARRRASSNT